MWTQFKGADHVVELIEAVGARLLFLPAYSPDFAPLALAWRPVKVYLRRVAARTVPDLQAAAEPAMGQVTPEQARSYFAHCGYQTLQAQ